MISAVLVKRYRSAKLHEDKTYREMQDHLMAQGIYPSEESVEKCQRKIAVRQCLQSFTFAGTHTMVLQLLELNYAITSDLGTIVYHLMNKLDNEDRLWGRPAHLCLNANTIAEVDYSESDILYLKSVSDPDTPEQVCEQYDNDTGCLAAVKFLCSEVQGACDERVSQLINGYSKVSAKNAVDNKCRYCLLAPETPSHIIIECPSLTQLRAHSFQSYTADVSKIWTAKTLAAFLSAPIIAEMEAESA